MTRWILGISSFYHDSAASLVKDGEIIAAAQEERFTRIKHDPSFPSHAIDYCLEEGRIEPSDLSAVAFYDNPILAFDRIIKTILYSAPSSFGQWKAATPKWLSLKLKVKEMIEEKFQREMPILYSKHHLSHAASSFYPSPFKEAAILIMDGVGEWATTTIGIGHDNQITLLEEMRYPHSIGLLYSAFTHFCGFKVNSGEYKLMGLAAYGEPKYEKIIRDYLIDVRTDGSLRLNMEYLGYLDSIQMINEKFSALFGGPSRRPESRITRREIDLAASIQKVTEDVILALARQAKVLTGTENLTLAGGVALNCVANGKLLKEQIFKKLWIQPAAGDSGGSLGAALAVTYQYFNLPRKPLHEKKDHQKGSFLGPSYSNHEVRAFLDYHDYPYHKVSNEERAKIVAEQISQGKIVGYMVGRMEFGPRSLGARSILGDARNEKTQATMNLKIKFRESFRPFAPVVIEEKCKDYFDLDEVSPYMLFVAQVKKERCLPRNNDVKTDDLLEMINRKRSDIPAVTHVDYSARIQTVSSEEKQDFYAVLKEFERLTGHGLIVNTSFNVRGEPIVCSPEDAYLCFMRTDIDVLVLENTVLFKSEQPKFEENEDWQKKYELD